MFYNFLDTDAIKKVNQENSDFFDLCSNDSLEEDIAKFELTEAIQKEYEEALINY
jgi:hypothetical protein